MSLSWDRGLAIQWVSQPLISSSPIQAARVVWLEHASADLAERALSVPFSTTVIPRVYCLTPVLFLFILTQGHTY